MTDATAPRLDCRFQPGEKLSTPEAAGLLDAHYARTASTFQARIARMIDRRAPGNIGIVEQSRAFGYRLCVDACSACGRGGTYQSA